MALIIFDGEYQTFSEKSFSELSGPLTWKLGTEATPTKAVTYTVPTGAINGAILLPEFTTSAFQGQANVSGVLTDLSFKPNGSVKGATVAVEERSGTFAYYQEYIAAGKALEATANAQVNDLDPTTVGYINDAINTANMLIGDGGFASSTTVADKVDADAKALQFSGHADLASEAEALAGVAGEWQTATYWLNSGSGFKQVNESDLGFGINLKSVNGAESTWTVNGATGGVIVSGFTAVTTWASTGPVYNIYDAENGGEVDVSSQTDYTPPGTPLPPTLTAKSDTGSSSTDGITKDNTPTFSGIVNPGAKVTLYDGATKVGSATANKQTGVYSVTATKLSDGGHDLTVTVTEGSLTSSPSALTSVTIDTTPPAKPSAPTLSASSDSGISQSDKITNDTAPTFTGYAEADATVTLYDGSKVIGTTTADDNGAYTITSSTLKDGTHTIDVKATDIAGNVSAASASVKVTIDTKAPAPVILTKSGSSSAATETITGKGAAGDVVTLYLNGSPVGPAFQIGSNGKWSETVTFTVDGIQSLQASETDAAGNVGNSAPAQIDYVPSAGASHNEAFTSALFDGFFRHSGSSTSTPAPRATSALATYPNITTSVANIFGEHHSMHA